MFYAKNVESQKFVKIIPKNLTEYLTPLALAIWFMDDGSKLGQGAKIAVNCFKQKDIELVGVILKTQYNIDSAIHKAGKDKGFTLYIPKRSMPVFAGVVRPHILPSMLYKLGHY